MMIMYFHVCVLRSENAKKSCNFNHKYNVLKEMGHCFSLIFGGEKVLNFLMEELAFSA